MHQKSSFPEPRPYCGSNGRLLGFSSYDPALVASREFATIKYGADPNYAGQKLYPVYPLHEAATAGNLSLVRKLLDCGALPNRPGGSPANRFPVLWWAFAREHTSVIQLLLDRGASLHGGPGDKLGKGWVGKSLAEMTSALGYHSMVEILRQHGVDIIDPPTYQKKGYHYWHGFSDAQAIAPWL